MIKCYESNEMLVCLSWKLIFLVTIHISWRLSVYEVCLNVMIIVVFSEVKLTPQDIDRIVQTLKNFSGTNEEKDVLEDIDWVEGKRQSANSTVLL